MNKHCKWPQGVLSRIMLECYVCTAQVLLVVPALGKLPKENSGVEFQMWCSLTERVSSQQQPMSVQAYGYHHITSHTGLRNRHKSQITQ